MFVYSSLLFFVCKFVDRYVQICNLGYNTCKLASSRWERSMWMIFFNSPLVSNDAVMVCFSANARNVDMLLVKLTGFKTAITHSNYATDGGCIGKKIQVIETNVFPTSHNITWPAIYKIYTHFHSLQVVLCWKNAFVSINCILTVSKCSVYLFSIYSVRIKHKPFTRHRSRTLSITPNSKWPTAINRTPSVSHDNPRS